MNRPLRICVLGSTGSVGSQALEVIRAYPDRFQLVGLCANSSAEALAKQVEFHRPARVALSDSAAAERVRDLLEPDLAGRVASGEHEVAALGAMPEADVVVAAVVGKAGLAGVVAAVEAGKRVALANKEALVMAGELVTSLARSSGARLLPVDSEHASLAQLIEHLPAEQVRNLVLTASGGPFVNLSLEQLAKVGPEDALAHPNWNMGAKISIDSATMMNKGFEIIEARWLFDLPLSQIEALIHPESLVHALVELIDGSVLAHMGPADMRLPIAWALAHPDRLDLGQRLERFSWLDLTRAGGLSFHPVQQKRWPAIGLCKRALEAGGGTEAALAAADEVAVAAFLAGRIGFLDILAVLEQVLDSYSVRTITDLEDVLAAAREGERLADLAIGSRAS